MAGQAEVVPLSVSLVKLYHLLRLRAVCARAHNYKFTPVCMDALMRRALSLWYARYGHPHLQFFIGCATPELGYMPCIDEAVREGPKYITWQRPPKVVRGAC